jgi:Lrp/AsnC family transcriptional regulator, leucine-responsive regulatory protein
LIAARSRATHSFRKYVLSRSKIPPEAEQLDDFERRILQALQEDARLGMQELAEKIGLSVSPTWRRVKSLEERGFITRYAALLDPEKAGVPECVFAHITLIKHDRAGIAEFEEAIVGRPEVLECFATTGDADYLLRVVVPNTRAYERFLEEAIFTRPVVQHVRSNFALRQVKFTVSLPIP